MLVPLRDCNRHCFFLPSKTLVNPSFQIPGYRYPVFPFKSLCRRGSVSAAASEAETRAVPQSAIQRIAEKLRSLGYVDESSDDGSDEASIPARNSPGEIFVPLPSWLPKHRVGHTLDPSWSTPENPVPDPGSGRAMQRLNELRRGVLEEEEKERIRKRAEGKERAPTLAELTLSKEELMRLRSGGIGLKNKLKVGKAGITEGIVNGIHERWRRSELVKITCEDISRLNMKRTHELLERKTGGLVIWRSGRNIILYRGPGYKYPYFLANQSSNDSSSEESRDIDINQSMPGKEGVLSPVISAAETPGQNSDIGISRPPLVQGVGLPNRVRFQLPGEAELADEADALLEGLGPRFDDWWGCEPLPVDADLLPAVVPGYRRPFRLLPYGVKPKLTNDEMTILRRLGRPLPCHFALGRNRKLQGLAVSIVKLWEKCEIAKIAVKRGVQNTNSVLMAEELKGCDTIYYCIPCFLRVWLTGGTLLSRDREFIVFYRGKDFLPAAVSSAIEERRKNRIYMSKTITGKGKEHKFGGKEYGTDAGNDKEKDQRLQGHSEERKPRFSEAAIDRTDAKLSLAITKKERAEKLLAKLQEEEILKPAEMDKEGITEEERYMLRKVGLRMKPFLLLGRRGVFDGTVENMHLHWKYRELVKVCIGGRPIEEIHGIARTLEAESGGILVAIERVSKGYAIIVYRGKNYTRPPSLRPRTLLSKREAMKRSIEAQRRESLKLHVLKLSKNIDELKLRKQAKGENTNKMQLTEDSNIGFQETRVNFDNDGTWFDGKTENNYEFVSGDFADEASEGPGTDVNSKGLENPLHTSKDTTHIGLRDLPRDISLESAVKGDYLSDAAETEIRLGPLLQETKCFQSLIQPCGNVEPSHSMPEDQLISSTTSYPQPETRGRDPLPETEGRDYQPETGGRDSQPETGGRHSSVDGCKNIDVEPHVQNAAPNEKPPVMPSKGSQLSNRERLLLRKQALRMKKPPLLAVGKSNVITGIAKVIKEHFEKHPLAIVNIKGRAKGTSAQEVIYNLEQATGAVLVSQEPSKVILYRGWGSGVNQEPADDKDSKNEPRHGEVKTQRPISPELMSAIRFECGLQSADEKHTASERVMDSDN